MLSSVSIVLWALGMVKIDWVIQVSILVLTLMFKDIVKQ